MVVVGKVGDDKLWRNEKDLSWLYIYMCVWLGVEKKKKKMKNLFGWEYKFILMLLLQIFFLKL